MSRVSIVNKAIAFIGDNRITDLSDDTMTAKAFNNIYVDSLKSILSECCWNFAKKRVVLNRLTETPAWGGGNYFQLPADVVRIFETTAHKWKIEGNYILTPESSVGILYTYLCEDDNKYPPRFVDALACRLAADVCFELTNNSSKQAELMNLYEGHYLPVAKSMNARDGSPDEIKDDAWVNAVYDGRWD
ncbi:MAG: hypothetical protein J6M62_10390 [Selenomonadaceae bacterium]|nr:hypothetical protein [Selenomonadaceae bacterium]